MLRAPYLNLDEVRLAEGNELGVGFEFVYVPGLHQGQAVHRALLLQDTCTKAINKCDRACNS